MARKKRKRSTPKPPTAFRPEVERYAEMLEAAGFDDREIARGVYYAQEYGLEALSRGAGCITFDEPACGNWNCLAPDHQVVIHHPPTEGE